MALRPTITTSSTNVAGSSTSVVKANVTSTVPVESAPIVSIAALAPVSWRTRRCDAVMRVNTRSATALPIEAMELRSKPAARIIAATAVASSPTDTRLPTRRLITGGNWPTALI